MNTIRKFKLIKRVLIPIMVLAIFLMPIGPSLNIKKSFADDKKETKIIIETAGIMSKSASFKVTITDTVNEYLDNVAYYNLYDKVWDNSGQNKRPPDVKKVYSDESPIKTNLATQNFTISFGNNANPLTPAHEYFLVVNIIKGSTNFITGITINGEISEHSTFSTPPDDTTQGEITGNQDANINGELDLGCTINPLKFSIYGCVAELFYLVFQVASFVGKLAGWFLDFFVYYSTNSTSYKSAFVTQGWKTVRDVANIFFIIALLYIAIKTILNLNVSDNKKLISYIVIIALLINFSLFFTQVIIDSTNILAKVFYNNMTAVDKNGTAVSATGEKSISVGLISKFNPQKIISQEVYDKSGGTTLFIFTTILAICIVLYAAYIFFSVGLLFVSRVVMLWISMIFAPIAFASYTLPFDIPGLGHKEWWSELLKNAFLAPIFIFFLYIIVMFAGFLKTIVQFPEGADFMQKVLSVVIPFAILTVLLMKAKEIAIKYAGEMGAAMQKGGAMVGGLALGVAAGGAAMVMRNTVGKGALNNLEGEKGEALRERAKLKGFEGWKARQQLKSLETRAGGSFDLRKTAAGSKFASISGMNLESSKAIGLGSKEGGYRQTRENKIKKDQAWAEKIGHVGENSKVKQKMKNLEMDYQKLLGDFSSEIEQLDKIIDKRGKNSLDARNKLDSLTRTKKFKTEPPVGSADHAVWEAEETAIREAQVDYKKKTADYEEIKKQKKSLKDGVAYTGVDPDGIIITRDYTAARHDNGDGTSSSMNNYEDTLIPDAKKEVHHKEVHRKQAEAQRIGNRGFGSKTTNKESEYRIMSGAKLDAGAKH